MASCQWEVVPQVAQYYTTLLGDYHFANSSKLTLLNYGLRNVVDDRREASREWVEAESSSVVVSTGHKARIKEKERVRMME